ncbi:hypothetical protein ACLOJK_023963, partial [Asimina triloba]
EARFDVRFGAMKVDAGRRPVRFWGCHAIADLRKTLMDGFGSMGWVHHGKTLLLPKFGRDEERKIWARDGWRTRCWIRILRMLIIVEDE